jgi:hypothetical protein
MSQKQIDPRTTRRYVLYEQHTRNSALYSQYEVIGHVKNPSTDRIEQVWLQKKAEFCIHKVKT